MGNNKWSFAAETALICALMEYCTGEFDESLTHARIAQSGLQGAARETLLLPTLVLQSVIAFHRRQRDVAESTWQIAAHLQTSSEVERSWQSAIAAVAHFASGNFDQSASEAISAVKMNEIAGPHLTVQVPWLVLAHIARDRDQIDQCRDYINRGTKALDDFPALPLLAEFEFLKAHLEIDAQHPQAGDAIDSVAALSSHALATPALQEHIDTLEATLRIRTNEMTRARILTNRLERSPRKEFLAASIDAEVRPSYTLGVLAGGKYRWYRDQIDADIIRARARRRDLHTASIHLWRAIERALETGSVRPFLEVPIAAVNLSNTDLLQEMEVTRPRDDKNLDEHLEKILKAHSLTALTGPESHALSARELEILRAVADGGDFATVARVLVLSKWTVRGHFYSACRKLGVSGKEAAIAKLREIERPRPS